MIKKGMTYFHIYIINIDENYRTPCEQKHILLYHSVTALHIHLYKRLKILRAVYNILIANLLLGRIIVD